MPITIHDLVHLADEEFATFKLIAYIGEIKPVLNIRHTSNGTLITVNSIMAYRENILKNYGNVYKHTDPEKAPEYFKETKKILDSENESSKDNVNWKDAKTYILLNLGQTYRALKMYDEAVECYDEGIALVGDMRVKGDFVDMEQLVSFYNSRGNVERDLENLPNEETPTVYSASGLCMLSVMVFTKILKKFIEFYQKARRAGSDLKIYSDLFFFICTWSLIEKFS